MELESMEVLEKGKLYLNRLCRTIKSPGLLGARIQTGVGKEEGHATNGDCLLIDLHRNLFAVSDSPDRNPCSSRDFLVRWDQRMNEVEELNPARPISSGYFPELLKELKNSTEALMADTGYFDRTTFTALIIVPTETSLKGIVFHGGDSFIYRADLSNQEISRITDNNFWMVGRTGTISQVIEMDVTLDTRFIISSDGLNILTRGEREPLDQMLIKALNNHSIEEVPNILLEDFGQDLKFHDDYGVIAITPHSLPNCGPRLVKGGSDFNHEKQRRDLIENRTIKDVYEPIEISSDEMLIIPDK